MYKPQSNLKLNKGKTKVHYQNFRTNLESYVDCLPFLAME